MNEPRSALVCNGEVLPALGLVHRSLLPGSRCCVVLTTVSAYGAALEATRGWRPLLAVFSATAGSDGDPLSSVGVLATVTHLRNLRDRWVADLRAVGRVRKQELLRVDPFRLARVAPWPDREDDVRLAAVVRAEAARFAGARGCLARLVREQLRSAAPWEIPGVVMPLLEDVPWTAWQELLEADTLEERLAFVLAHLHAGCRRGAG